MKGPPARHEEQKEQFPAVEGIITDAADLDPGDRVVYPNQGVCRITGVERKEIAGQRLELVRMEREEDGAAVLVPKAKVPSIGLRKVATKGQIEGVFHYLAAQYDDPELDWKVRHRDNADRLIAGGVLGVAEVVKGLHALSRIRPLPTKEREQYDNARHLLVHEIAVSLAVPPALAEDYIDYALMPPAGVTFKLKPPPKPVELPARPRRRPVARTDEDDLGLDELGLDLGTTEIEPGAEAEEGAVPAAEGALPAIPVPDDLGLPEVEAEPGGEPAEAEAEGDGEEPEAEADAEEEPPRPKKAPAKKPPPKPAAKEKEKEKAARPTKKPAPAKKATRPAEKSKPDKKKAAPAKKPAAKGKKK